MMTVFQLKAAKDRVRAERDEKLRANITSKSGSVAERRRIHQAADRKLRDLDLEYMNTRK